MNISPSACTIRKINHNLPLDSHWLHEAKCMGGVRRAYTRALIRYARLLQHHVIPRLLHPHLLDGAVSRVQSWTETRLPYKTLSNLVHRRPFRALCTNTTK